jgi:hypothetical protein
MMSSGPSAELIALEMSGSTLSISVTQGALNIWFGRNVDRELVAKLLITISRVDSTTEHQREVRCNFWEISEFENNGYILTSYARKDDLYRAVFVVPFSNPRALERFIESISDELQHGEVKLTLYWKGGRIRMNIIKEELAKLKCFTFVNTTYKDDQRESFPRRI